MDVDFKKKALGANSESTDVDFKREWDHTKDSECIELIKDVVAMANSGGGCILIGLDDHGVPVNGLNVDTRCDPAVLNDKIFKYTGVQASFLEMMVVNKDGIPLLGFSVKAVDVPIPFANPGTYELPDKKQKTVFGRGTVYFRHGAKSEPANYDDFRRFIERSFAERRKFLLQGMAKVIDAPVSSVVRIAAPGEDFVEASPVRITTDPNAPMMSAPMVDKSHPYRQKELLEKVNARLPAAIRLSTHDFLCVRRTQGIHRDLKYCYNMNWSSPRYSEACIDWLVNQVENDHAFVHRARETYTQIKEGKAPPK